jgi:hypothetical protein
MTTQLRAPNSIKLREILVAGGVLRIGSRVSTKRVNELALCFWHDSVDRRPKSPYGCEFRFNPATHSDLKPATIPI